VRVGEIRVKSLWLTRLPIWPRTQEGPQLHYLVEGRGVAGLAQRPLKTKLVAWAICLTILWLTLVTMLPSEATKALGKMLKAGAKLTGLFFSGIMVLLRIILAAVSLLFGLIEGRRTPPT